MYSVPRSLYFFWFLCLFRHMKIRDQTTSHLSSPFILTFCPHTRLLIFGPPKSFRTSIRRATGAQRPLFVHEEETHPTPPVGTYPQNTGRSVLFLCLVTHWKDPKEFMVQGLKPHHTELGVVKDGRSK